jgi:hypothetical protein
MKRPWCVAPMFVDEHDLPSPCGGVRAYNPGDLILFGVNFIKQS